MLLILFKKIHKVLLFIKKNLKYFIVTEILRTKTLPEIETEEQLLLNKFQKQFNYNQTNIDISFSKLKV